MTDLGRAGDAVRELARSVLGSDPGAMELAVSDSHHVYVGRSVVVKIIDAGDHSRLDREIRLVDDLPAGITPSLLGSGRSALGSRAIRYACFRTASGVTPGMHLPTTDEDTAVLLCEQAVQRLGRLHRWTPGTEADRVLREPIDHGGFVGRSSLQADVAALTERDTEAVVPRGVLDGLRAISSGAPLRAEVNVPVHADSHWGNWLADGSTLTALLDFEWARFGTPVDDWFFLIRFSGPHQAVVLDTIARLTEASPADLRAACEVREAAYLVSDLLVELERRPSGDAVPALVRDLTHLTVGRSWWPGRH